MDTIGQIIIRIVSGINSGVSSILLLFVMISLLFIGDVHKTVMTRLQMYYSFALYSYYIANVMRMFSVDTIPAVCLMQGIVWTLSELVFSTLSPIILAHNIVTKYLGGNRTGEYVMEFFYVIFTLAIAIGWTIVVAATGTYEINDGWCYLCDNNYVGLNFFTSSYILGCILMDVILCVIMVVLFFVHKYDQKRSVRKEKFTLKNVIGMSLFVIGNFVAFVPSILNRSVRFFGPVFILELFEALTYPFLGLFCLIVFCGLSDLMFKKYKEVYASLKKKRRRITEKIDQTTILEKDSFVVVGENIQYQRMNENMLDEDEEEMLKAYVQKFPAPLTNDSTSSIPPKPLTSPLPNSQQ